MTTSKEILLKSGFDLILNKKNPKKTVQIEKDHCCPGFKALKRKTDNENVKQTKSLKIEENILR